MIWSVLREAARSLLFLPTSMALARLLSPEEAGIAAAAGFFTQLAGRLTQFGFGQALVRLKEMKEEHLSVVFAMSLAFGLATWAVLTFGANAAGRIFDNAEIAKVLPLAGLEFIIISFGAAPSAILSRDMRYKEGVTTESLAWTAECGVSVFMAWAGFSYFSMVYGGIAGDLIRVTGRVWLTKWRPRLSFSRAAAKEVFSFGFGLYFKNLLEYGTQNLDNLIVGRVLGVTALGFYDKAFSAMNRLTTRMNLGGPAVSFRLFALIQEDLDRFRRGFRKVILSATLVSYPGITGLIVVAPELIDVLFGARWSPAVVPFQILCGAGMLRILNSYASTATQAMGLVWSEVLRHSLFIVVLTVSVWIMSRWDISGAALGVLTATFVMTVLLQSLVRRFTGFSWADLLSPQIPAAICSAGMLAVLMGTKWGLAAIGGVHSLVSLFVCAAVGAVYFLGFLMLAPFADVRDVVHETLKEVAPPLAARLRFLAPPRQAAARG